jgi:exosortase
MLTSTTLQTLSASQPSRYRRPGWEILVIAAVAMIAHFPLLVRHAEWLWQRPHYQFFPLVVVGAGILAYVRMRHVLRWQPGSAIIAAVGLTLSWLLLAIADLLASTWLGSVATMFLIMTLVYAAGGLELCRQALPAWMLLWFVVPPPFDLDRVLMFKLQNLTTEWSSSVLDVLGVFHVRSGNVIEVDERKLMVEQACSGINSLYSLLACTVFLVFLTRCGWVRGSLLVAVGIGWVLAANVARVTGVVYLNTRWGIDLSSGWRHEAFGVFLFALAVGLLMSTDQLFVFLTRSIPRTLNNKLHSAGSVNASETRPFYSHGLRRLAFVSIPAYAVLAIAFWASDKTTNDMSVAQMQLHYPDKDCLPTKIGSWEQAEYASLKREASSFYGEQSRVWKYSNTRNAAILSVDFPFMNWHDLTWCYVGKGWHIDNQVVRDDPGVPGGFLEVRMTQSTHRHGYLVFCEFSSEGKPFVARPGGTEASLFRHQTTLLRAKALLGFDREQLTDPPGPIYQLQLFLEGYDQLSVEDEAALTELFVRSSANIREFCSTHK